MKTHRKLLLKYWATLNRTEKIEFLLNLVYNKCPFFDLPEGHYSVDSYLNSLTEEELDFIWLEVCKNV